MDNLVLVRVAAVLGGEASGSVLDRVAEPGLDRFLLAFRTEDRSISVAVSVRAELPWIGRMPGRGKGRKEAGARAPGPFAALCTRALAGAKVVSIVKDPMDRVATIVFASGHRLVAEMATHAANLILLGPDGKTVASARHPRGGRERLRPGILYTGRAIPAGKVPVAGSDPGEIDRIVSRAEASGHDPVDALRRQVFGLGTEAAVLVLEESRAIASSPGRVLAARVEALVRGDLDPVIEGQDDPDAAPELSGLDPARFRLLPWAPVAPAPAMHWTRRDAAATAGLYYDGVERFAWVASRLEALRGILLREIDRTLEAERKAEADLVSHGSPDRHRAWGEALLAGMSRARRTGDQAFVPDPYDVEERWIEVPAPGHLSLAAAAEDHFRRHRRAERGLTAAATRSRAMRVRRGRLEEVQSRHESSEGGDAARALAEAMRDEGIPVQLAPATRSGRERSERSLPKLEGVRLLTSGDGFEILVGRSAKDNDHLTFRLSGPEDFWFHAQGFPGAHVVVRNPERRPRPPQQTLVEAASIAAWYSDARGQGFVDVHWTRRKNVRRARGGPPGTVTLKRFESLRVRPRSEP